MTKYYSLFLLFFYVISSRQLLSSSGDKTSGVWDVESGRCVRRLRAHAATVTTSVFNEESTLVLSGSQDNSVKIWDLRSKSNTRPIQSLDEPTDAITSLAVNNNGVLVGCADSFTRFYDIRNGKLKEDCMGEAVTCVAMSRDNASHLVSVGDGTCKLIDESTGQLLASYTNYSTPAFHDYKVEAAFDFMDQFVLVGSPLAKVLIYDLISEKVVKEVPTLAPVVSLTAHSTKDAFAIAASSTLSLFQSPSTSTDSD